MIEFAMAHPLLAIVVLGALLLVEEAGVPLPFAPGDLVLVVGGVMVAAGAVSLWVLLPVAIGASAAGAMIGFTWCRHLGARRLQGLAARLHVASALDRASERLRAAGPVGIAAGRMIPGLRIYTTLVAGALGVRRSVFIAGALPSILVWVGAFTALGIVVGAPAEHLLTQMDGVAVRVGGLAILIAGVVAAIRMGRRQAGRAAA